MSSTQTPTREFAAPDVLAVYTGVLLLPDQMPSVYEVLDFLFDRPHLTHELPDARDVALPFLDDQFPELQQLPPVPEGDVPNTLRWLADAVDTLGLTFVVKQVPVDDRF